MMAPQLKDQFLFPFIDGTTPGDGTTVGKCPNSLRCISSGHCQVCKIVGNNHEGCSGSTPFCDETINPPQCSGCAAASGELMKISYICKSIFGVLIPYLGIS